MFKLINESSSPKSKLKKVAKFQHSLTAVFRAEIIPNLYIYILTINKAAHKGPQRERRVNCNKCTAKNKKTDSQKKQQQQELDGIRTKRSDNAKATLTLHWRWVQSAAAEGDHLQQEREFEWNAISGAAGASGAGSAATHGQSLGQVSSQTR